MRILSLCVQADGTPKLQLGKMQLEGKEVKLKKPLAIMSLVKREDGTSEYHAAGVVRQKVVFKTRPVPVSRPQAAVPATDVKRMRTLPPAHDKGLTMGTATS